MIRIQAFAPQIKNVNLSSIQAQQYWQAQQKMFKNYYVILFLFKKFLAMVSMEEKCKNFYDLPKLIFRIGGIDYDLDPEEYAVTI